MAHLLPYRRPDEDADDAGLVGSSPAVQKLRARIDAIAGLEAPVLLTGESGSGKDTVARALHRASHRPGPLVEVNCAAFDDAATLEAHLFGDDRRAGAFEVARGGTLFLDEIAAIPSAVQAKLVHVLQTGVFARRGSIEACRVDVRLISASTPEPLTAGALRQDLYYRLKVLVIDVPPLRERVDDLPALVELFLHRYARGEPPRATGAAMRALERYPFPGNVRELENAIRHGVAVARSGQLDLEHLPPEVCTGWTPASDRPVRIRPLSESVRAFERTQILHALRYTRGSRIEAAQSLHISRKCLWEKMKAYEIREEEFATE